MLTLLELKQKQKKNELTSFLVTFSPFSLICFPDLSGLICNNHIAYEFKNSKIFGFVLEGRGVRRLENFK